MTDKPCDGEPVITERQTPTGPILVIDCPKCGDHWTTPKL